MSVEHREILAIRFSHDVVTVRQRAREWAAKLHFSLVDQTKMVTAASELGRNTLTYGEKGCAILEILREGVRSGLRITFQDEGPGIADVERALQDGYTTSGGLGLGLSGAKRLVNEFRIASRVGEGTTVIITRWK